MSLSALFCTFDEFECVWSEAKEQGSESLLSLSDKPSQALAISAVPVVTADAETQTDIIIIQEEDLCENFVLEDNQGATPVEQELNESVIGKTELCSIANIGPIWWFSEIFPLVAYFGSFL